MFSYRLLLVSLSTLLPPTCSVDVRFSDEQVRALRDSLRFIAFELHSISGVLDQVVGGEGGQGAQVLPSLFQSLTKAMMEKKREGLASGGEEGSAPFSVFPSDGLNPKNIKLADGIHLDHDTVERALHALYAQEIEVEQQSKAFQAAQSDTLKGSSGPSHRRGHGLELPLPRRSVHLGFMTLDLEVLSEAWKALMRWVFWLFVLGLDVSLGCIFSLNSQLVSEKLSQEQVDEEHLQVLACGLTGAFLVRFIPWLIVSPGAPLDFLISPLLFTLRVMAVVLLFLQKDMDLPFNEYRKKEGGKAKGRGKERREGLEDPRNDWVKQEVTRRPQLLQSSPSPSRDGWKRLEGGGAGPSGHPSQASFGRSDSPATPTPITPRTPATPLR